MTTLKFSAKHATVAASTLGVATALSGASFAFAATSTSPSPTEETTSSAPTTTSSALPDTAGVVGGCGTPNVALVIDNSSRLAPGTKNHDTVVNSYISYIDNLSKYSDSEGSITLFPMFTNPDVGNYYSQTFSLKNEKDMDKLKSALKNWEFDKPNKELWVSNDAEVNNIPQRGEMDLYAAVKRVQAVSKEKPFNLMTTITKPDIKTHSNETGETIAEVGEALRKEGVFIKAVMFTEYSIESSSYSSPDTFIAKMTSRNPEFNKDFFVSKVDDVSNSLDMALVDHCNRDESTPNGDDNNTSPTTSSSSDDDSDSTDSSSSSTSNSSNTSTSSTWGKGDSKEDDNKASSTTSTTSSSSDSEKGDSYSVSSSEDSDGDGEADKKGPEVDTGGSVVERSFFEKLKDFFSA